jgi:hypothetical protein
MAASEPVSSPWLVLRIRVCDRRTRPMLALPVCYDGGTDGKEHTAVARIARGFIPCTVWLISSSC